MAGRVVGSISGVLVAFFFLTSCTETTDLSSPSPTATYTLTSTTTASPSATSTASPSATLTATHTLTPQPGADRPRTINLGDTVLTGDTQVPLRCENPRSNDAASRNDPNWWADLRDNYHLNCIRIFARITTNLEPASAFRTDVQAWVDQASQHGFYAIIDYHLNPPGLQFSYPHAQAWWLTIAADHHDRSHVLFELINEPPGGLASNAAQRWLHDDVRSVAPQSHIIFFSSENILCNTVSSIQNAVNTHLSDIDWSLASIGVHMYWDPSFACLDTLLQMPQVLINTEVGSTWVNPDDEEIITVLEPIPLSWVTLDGATENRIPTSFVSWPRDPFFGP